jgi:DNA-binding FadR family transcriptional regulator
VSAAACRLVVRRGPSFEHWDRRSLAVVARPLKQLERAAAAGSAAHPTNEDREFHAAISRAASNEVLVSLLTPSGA